MKYSVDKTMEDIVSINNQINGLKMLLDSKKAIMAKYFEKTNSRRVDNDECSVFIQERTSIEYDVPAIRKKLPKDKVDMFVETTREVQDWGKFVALMKRHGVTPSELSPFIHQKSVVNQDKLSKLYEKGVVELTDLEGCYNATVKKSIALRMKNVDTEIPITK